MKTYKIYFIRNGLTEGALSGKYIGKTDEPLCDAGVRQLRRLLEDSKYPYVQAVACSPKRRCLETAKILYPDRTPIIIENLKECDFGDFEEKTADELADVPLFRTWLTGNMDAAPPNGESNGAFISRICDAFRDLCDRLQANGITETAVVTHGGVIMALLSAFGLPQAAMPEWRTPGGCGYKTVLTPTVWARIQKIEVIDEIPFVSGSQEDEEII